MIKCKYYDDTYCLKCKPGYPEICQCMDDKEAIECCSAYEKCDETYVKDILSHKYKYYGYEVDAI